MVSLLADISWQSSLLHTIAMTVLHVLYGLIHYRLFDSVDIDSLESWKKPNSISSYCYGHCDDFEPHRDLSAASGTVDKDSPSPMQIINFQQTQDFATPICE